MVSTLLLMGHFGIQVYADISKNMSELVVTILEPKHKDKINNI